LVVFSVQDQNSFPFLKLLLPHRCTSTTVRCCR
jgi:hypothetical protein